MQTREELKQFIIDLVLDAREKSFNKEIDDHANEASSLITKAVSAIEKYVCQQQVGMKWVKASERLPIDWEIVVIRQISNRLNVITDIDDLHERYLTQSRFGDILFTDLEWLDESEASPTSQLAQGFQIRVNDWMVACFGEAIAKDVVERNHRFFEEAAELVQATGMTKSECLQLIDYVFNRPAGEVHQEIGGVIVTLSALCSALMKDMNKCGDIELERVWTKIDKIREKQANKPKHSPLPSTEPAQGEGDKKIWPFYGYAPGNYQNTCSICNKEVIVDKLCFVCLECAIAKSRSATQPSPEPVAAQGVETPFELMKFPASEGSVIDNNANESDELIQYLECNDPFRQWLKSNKIELSPKEQVAALAIWEAGASFIQSQHPSPAKHAMEFAPPSDFTLWVVVNKWQYDYTVHKWWNDYIGEVKGVVVTHDELYELFIQSKNK